MNFLAHLYLSGNDEPLMVGNFIADHIRGYDWKAFPQQIQNGILLHRFIDEYTDNHPIVEQSKALMRNTFHKYTPVISDIYFDHFFCSINGWAHTNVHHSFKTASHIFYLYIYSIYSIARN